MTNPKIYNKLTLYAYSKIDFSESNKIGEFTTVVNPEKLMVAKKVIYQGDTASGNSNTPQKFDRIESPELDFNILFDGTGVIPGMPNDVPIKKQMDEFERLFTNMDGETHQLSYIKLIWGSFILKGVLSDISYEYKLFDSDGEPIRVVAKIKIKNTIADELRAAQENKSSPDLTHTRQVVEGDTLPQLCFKVYGDSKYYLEVAKTNRISNFRKLTPGQRINFPPVEKLS